MNDSSPYLGLGTRLDSGPSSLLVSTGFSTEVQDGRYLHFWMGVADLVHVLALRDVDAIPAASSGRLLQVLLEMLTSNAGDLAYDPSHGDIYNSREHLMRGLLGEDAGWLHLGRTRREAGRTAFYLAARDLLLTLHEHVHTFAAACHDVALQHTRSWWADTTYLQPAQVSTLGHYLLSFGHEAGRHLGRVEQAHKACENLPIAAGGVAGTTVPLRRRSYTERIGIGIPATTSRDAMWSTDVLVELTHVAAQAALTISRLAEDLLIFATPAFGYVRIDDAHSRASVYLPQKRNPYALMVIRGGASHLVGKAAGVMTTTRTPSAQTDNWIYGYGDALGSLDECASLVLLAAETLSAARFDTVRLESAALAGFTDASDLAEHLVSSRGMDFRTAHEAVARVTAAADRDHRDRFSDEDYRVLMPDATPWQSGDLEALVAARRQEGGAAPHQVRSSAGRLARRLSRAHAWEDRARAASESSIRGIIAEATSASAPAR